MRFLFRKLFATIGLKYIPLVVLILILLQFAFGILKSTYIEFPLDKSLNPKASEHFVNAMQYKLMINKLHGIVDYDNVLMKPFLNKMNEEYEKGKALLPHNSAEDVYWYVILYRGIHGIGGIPDDYDMSMAYKSILSKEEYAEHYQEIINKIRRLATDDFNFDVPRITQYKYEFMVNLVDEVLLIIDSLKKIDEQIFLNQYYEKDIRDIYAYYIDFSQKYLQYANKQNENLVDFITNRIRLNEYILSFKIHQTRKANCDAQEYINLIENIKLLKQMSLKPEYKNQTFYYENIFNSIMIYESMIIADKYCPNLKEESVEVLKYFNPELETKLYKEQ
ncbi:MAG: hypothetical protein M0P43_03810 [Arcobacteraceae bacterium]|nr:hypothetical protein [Arcobacteraceae bacterium]